VDVRSHFRIPPRHAASEVHTRLDEFFGVDLIHSSERRGASKDTHRCFRGSCWLEPVKKAVLLRTGGAPVRRRFPRTFGCMKPSALEYGLDTSFQGPTAPSPVSRRKSVARGTQKSICLLYNRDFSNRPQEPTIQMGRGLVHPIGVSFCRLLRGEALCRPGRYQDELQPRSY
jgi:hypothetical protein